MRPDARVVEKVVTVTGSRGPPAGHAVRAVSAAQISAGFTVGQYPKDLNICVDLSEEKGTLMLLRSAVRQAWMIAAQEGVADQNHTTLVDLLER
jgi:3-hydroxyisobutyrate dehydrogenase-like beta-hydroxyacid dehydrogenase